MFLPFDFVVDKRKKGIAIQKKEKERLVFFPSSSMLFPFNFVVDVENKCMFGVLMGGEKTLFDNQKLF